MKVVPEWHEGDAEEKAEGAAKLGDQGGHRVDQLLRRDLGVVGDRPERYEELVRFQSGSLAVRDEAVLVVMARLGAVRQLGDLLQLNR